MNPPLFDIAVKSLQAEALKSPRSPCPPSPEPDLPEPRLLEKAMGTLDHLKAIETKKGGPIPLYQCRRPRTLKEFVEYTELHREADEAKIVPPLDIILYEDLVHKAWYPERLLPWSSGYVFFEQYAEYLKKFLLRNTDNTSAHDAAKRCLDEERRLGDICKLNSIRSNAGLISEISKKATDTINSAPDSPLTAACFMCIGEEFKLMSEWLTKVLLKDVESMAKPWQWISSFGYEVQKLALEILTMYKGNNTDQITASMLGMRNEAVIECNLLVENENDFDYKRIDICKELRVNFLDLFVLLRDKCLEDSASDVSPNAHSVDMAKNLTKLQISEQKETTTDSTPVIPESCMLQISERNEIASACWGLVVPGDTSVTSTPVTMKNAAPATPVPCSAGSVINDEFHQSSNNKINKRKSTEWTQDSLLEPEVRKHGRVEDKLGPQISCTTELVSPATTQSEIIHMESHDNESGQEVQGIEEASTQAGSSMSGPNVDEVCQIANYLNVFEVRTS